MQQISSKQVLASGQQVAPLLQTPDAHSSSSEQVCRHSPFRQDLESQSTVVDSHSPRPLHTWCWTLVPSLEQAGGPQMVSLSGYSHMRVSLLHVLAHCPVPTQSESSQQPAWGTQTTPVDPSLQQRSVSLSQQASPHAELVEGSQQVAPASTQKPLQQFSPLAQHSSPQKVPLAASQQTLPPLEHGPSQHPAAPQHACPAAQHSPLQTS